MMMMTPSARDSPRVSYGSGTPVRAGRPARAKEAGSASGHQGHSRGQGRSSSSFLWEPNGIERNNRPFEFCSRFGDHLGMLCIFGRTVLSAGFLQSGLSLVSSCNLLGQIVSRRAVACPSWSLILRIWIRVVPILSSESKTSLSAFQQSFSVSSVALSMCVLVCLLISTHFS